MLLMVSNAVAVQYITVKTNITVDFVGNNQVYIRTEDYNRLINLTNQVDTKFEIEVTRPLNETQCNTTTDTKLILNGVKNMTRTCEWLNDDYNFTQKYADEKEAHERVTVYYADCKEDKGYYISLSENQSKDIELCKSRERNCLDREVVCLNHNTEYVSSYNLLNQTYKNDMQKSKNNVMLAVVVSLAGAYGVYAYSKNKTKKPTKPSGMRGYSPEG